MPPAPAQKSALFGRLFGVQLGVILGSTTLLLAPADEKKGDAEEVARLNAEVARLEALLAAR